MELPLRLDSAIRKLYTAFHENKLHPEYCTKCAVGNICDNLDFWQHITDSHGAVKLNYVGLVNQKFGKRYYGYSPLELLQIEAAFLRGCGYELPIKAGNKKPKNPTDKYVLFDGLCATVEILCQLENIPNIMEYEKLFEVEKDKPRYQLNEILK